MQHGMKLGASLAALLLASACASTVEKLENVGKAPPMSEIQNPNAEPGYQPLSWPLPQDEPPQRQYANSLWQPGAKAFFRDQRANKVGDILRVNITINDRAELANETSRSRTSTEDLAAPSVFGLQEELFDWLPGNQNPNNLADITSNTATQGTGDIAREERIDTQIAALVTQVLPNGNLVISGTQEMRVNFEVREIGVSGVVRPEDIRNDNTIDSTQIAEARITYGGRGQLTNVQQPRYGQQVIDILSPF